jgi:hypothetical protein
MASRCSSISAASIPKQHWVVPSPIASICIRESSPCAGLLEPRPPSVAHVLGFAGMLASTIQ